MSPEDTLNKLLDYTSIELALQKLFCRHGAPQVWGYGDMKLGPKFRLGLVNRLAGEMQNLT